MDSSIKPSLSFRQILRYVEWSFIGIFVLVYIIERNFSISIVLLQNAVYLAAYALLSCFFPINRSLWQKLGYILLGFSLALSIRFTGADLNLFLYFYIAKTCFLLDRKYLPFIVVIVGVFDVLTFIQTLPITLQVNYLWRIDVHNSQQIQQAVLQHLTNYFVIIVFTIAFSFMVIAEQKSRQKAEALTQEVEILATTLERTRISRDIHDSLGHSLTNLQIQLAVAQKLRQRDIEKTLQAVDTAKILADQCIEDVSHALQTMRQTEFNLYQALTALLKEFRHKQGIKVEWELDLPQLPLQKSHQIYYIVKEGLINIQKHARASEVSFRAYKNNDVIILELKDNGIGFDSDVPHAGFGLKGLFERVFLLGGKLKINSLPASGTCIQVQIPL